MTGHVMETFQDNKIFYIYFFFLFVRCVNSIEKTHLKLETPHFNHNFTSCKPSKSLIKNCNSFHINYLSFEKVCFKHFIKQKQCCGNKSALKINRGDQVLGNCKHKLHTTYTLKLCSAMPTNTSKII